jgi:hypothetical protein
MAWCVTPHRSARISVWPAWWTPPARSDSLLIGSVVIASMRPSRARSMAVIRKSHAAQPARPSTRPGATSSRWMSVASRQGIACAVGSACSGRSIAWISAVPPTQASARLRTAALPTTNGRASVRRGDSPQARAMISGPTPATSPIVSATSGRSSCTVPLLVRRPSRGPAQWVAIARGAFVTGWSRPADPAGRASVIGNRPGAGRPAAARQDRQDQDQQQEACHGRRPRNPLRRRGDPLPRDYPRPAGDLSSRKPGAPRAPTRRASLTVRPPGGMMNRVRWHGR